MKKPLQAVIFPHSRLPEEKLKQVLSVFERVILFQPWFMEKAFSAGEEFAGMIEVLNPPERLKPAEDFKRLLAEYRQWIKLKEDRGFPASLVCAEERLEADPAIYEIRGMIRNKGRGLEVEERAKTLRWHITLHLAEEMEEEQQSAEKLLRKVSGMDSPLKGAVEGDIPGGILEDRTLGGETLFSEKRLTQILEAWTALYEEEIEGKGPLITVQPEVMAFIVETWEEFVGGGVQDRPAFSFSTPDPSTLGRDEFLPWRESYLAGSGLKKAILGPLERPETGFPPMRDKAAAAVPETSGLDWAFHYLPPMGEQRLPRRFGFMKKLSGKLLGLVKERAGHGA